MPSMPWFTKERNRALTGRVRFQQWGDGVTVQVEETAEKARAQFPRPNEEDYEWYTLKEWRDAKPLDMSSPALRWLIDGPVAATRVAA